MSAGGVRLASSGAGARPALPPDEREFLPALRAIERSRRLSPQLAMLGRAHTALGALALGGSGVALALAAAGTLLADPPTAWLAGVGAGVALMLCALSAPWLALGYGLRHRRRWARSLGVACGLALLPLAPLGTALGAWTLIVLAGWQPRLADVAAAD